MGRHARVIEKEAPIRPEDDASSGPEAFRAHEALTMAIGAAYNGDADGLRQQLLIAYGYFATHSHLNMQIWFVEKLIDIFDVTGQIGSANYFSQHLLPTMQLADDEGRGYMLAIAWNPW